MPIQLKVNKEKWNKEFSKGRWNCLDSSPTERARHAIIGMYCRHFFPRGKILDVGCGEGTLTDFLSEAQKKRYVGIDISLEAIKIANKKRKLNFQCIQAEQFKTKNKFDIVIFNEILYYLDDIEIFKKYSEFLKSKGIIIMSLYRMKNKRYDRQIRKNSKKFFKAKDAIEISGRIKNQNVIWRVEVLEKK